MLQGENNRISPKHDKEKPDDRPNRLENNMTRCAECVAIGECGLDFNRNFSPPEVQIEVFEKQVALYSSRSQRLPTSAFYQVLLACELGKPLFLHERDAHPEMVGILERWSLS